MALTENELSRLRNLMPRVQFTARQRGAGLVVTFDLGEDFEIGPLLEFIATTQGTESMYSVWISLTSSGDQGGVSLPAHILAVIRETSCGVDFSFAACLEDSSS